MSTDDCLTKYHVTLRVGHTQVQPAPDATTRTLSAVEQHNQNVRLPGLKDDLNPAVLDTAKVKAFLGKLPTLPSETLQQLQDKILYLNAPTLSLGASSPIISRTLEQGYSLRVPDASAGQLIQPTLNAAIDKEQAQNLASRAREATTQFNQEVERLEPKVTNIQNQKESGNLGEVLRELSQAKSKRFAAATVWRDNSIALASADLDNSALQADAEEAKKAASSYVSPPTTGMPAPG